MDKEGNSVPHPAIAERNQMTHLDVKAMKAERVRGCFGSACHQTLGNNEISPSRQSPVLPQQQNKGKKKKNKMMKMASDWLENYAASMVVVATLTTSVTFQAAINPPGGECAKLNANCNFYIGMNHGGNATGCFYNIGQSDIFMPIDTAGFLSSLSIIMIIISGFHLQQRVVMWVLMLMMATAITSVIGVLSLYFSHFNVKDATMLCFGLFPLIIVLSSIPLGRCLLNKLGLIGKEETEGKPEMV